MPLAMELDSICKSFARRRILDHVTLSIASGRICALIGPSGSGKSTTIALALGMEKPDSGTASVFGTSMPNRRALARIGYMAQADALYSSLTGQENLDFFSTLKGVPRRRRRIEIENVSRIVGLTDALGRRVSTYSGGMLRRLSLAASLLGTPDLLILDEPTVGIDPALRLSIWAELRRLSASGTAILLTTHVMDEATKADDVAMLFSGRIMAYGSPSELMDRHHASSIEEVFLTMEGNQSHHAAE